MTVDLSAHAKQIIADIEYITLASVTPDGLPWNSPVFTAYDQNYVFYFGTHVNSQKAKNLQHQPMVYCVIYDSTTPSGTGYGVYIQGKARVLTGKADIVAAHTLLTARHSTPYWQLDEVLGDTPIRLYKIIPEKVWMNDGSKARGVYIDTRTEIYL